MHHGFGRAWRESVSKAQPSVTLKQPGQRMAAILPSFPLFFGLAEMDG